MRVKWWYILWLLLLFGYEGPNFVFLAYKAGLLKKWMEQHTQAQIELNWRWYPSVQSLTEHLLGSSKDEQIVFVQANVLSPWGRQPHIIFKRPFPVRSEQGDELPFTVRQAGQFPWGQAYFVLTPGHDKTIKLYVPEPGLGITTQEMTLLFEIKNITPKHWSSPELNHN